MHLVAYPVLGAQITLDAKTTRLACGIFPVHGTISYNFNQSATNGHGKIAPPTWNVSASTHACNMTQNLMAEPNTGPNLQQTGVVWPGSTARPAGQGFDRSAGD